jgi:hypothetical protein
MVLGKVFLKKEFDLSDLRSFELTIPYLAKRASLSKDKFGKYFLTT